MKKKLLFILVLLCTSCAVAFSQEKNGVFVEFSGGFSNERDIEYYHHPAILTPGIGYKINDKWAVGMRASFELGNDWVTEKEAYNEENRYYFFTPYARFSFVKVGPVRFFTEGSVSWVKHSWVNDWQPSAPSWFDKSGNGFEAGMNIGVSCEIFKHLDVFARGFFVGYSNTGVTHEGAVAGNGRFILDANWRRAAIGLRFVI